LCQGDDREWASCHLRFRAVARRLEDRLGWYGNAIPGSFEQQAWLRYSWLVLDRDAFIGRFGKQIDLGIWFPTLVFGREVNAEAVGYRGGDCLIAERVARHIVNIPTHPRIPMTLFESLWSRHGGRLRSQLVRLDTARGV